MIIGVGVDTVDIARFTQQLNRTPALARRLFTVGEQDLEPASLAARFAAKEALIKALGSSDGVEWQQLEVLAAKGERPQFSDTAGLSKILHDRGAAQPHLSLTHDGGVAIAFVVLETAVSEEMR